MNRAQALTAAVAMAVCASASSAADVEYPKTKKTDTVLTIGGNQVPDPYQWLENDVRENEEVAAWVKAENAVTFGLLDQIVLLRDGMLVPPEATEPPPAEAAVAPGGDA